MHIDRPIVGLTCELWERESGPRPFAALAYSEAVTRAGGIPIMLPPIEQRLPEFFALCDGFVLTGGYDPITEPFGVPTHPKATPVDPRRQQFELAVLDHASTNRVPTLGVCLGEQYMALHAGGELDQHLPETLATHERHWDRQHDIIPCHEAAGFERAACASTHRQAVRDPGSLTVVAMSDDGVIEAVADLDHPFYLGVQWHPERTTTPALGQALFDRLVAAIQAERTSSRRESRTPSEA